MVEEEGIIAFAEEGHTAPSCIPCIRKLGRSQPPNRTRGPREIGGTSLAAEAESIGGGEGGGGHPIWLVPLRRCA